MDELIKQVIDTLGLDESVTRKALGAALAFLKNHVGEDFDFSSVLSKLKGAEGLIKDAEKDRDVPTATGEGPKPRAGGTTLLEQLLSWILSPSILETIKKFLKPFLPESAMKMIESAGGGAELVGTMSKLGLSSEQGTQIVTMLVDLIKSKVGPEVLDQLAEQVPVLKTFGSKKEN